MMNINDLEKLHELKEKGVITEEEFNQKKNEFLLQDSLTLIDKLIMFIRENIIESSFVKIGLITIVALFFISLISSKFSDESKNICINQLHSSAKYGYEHNSIKKICSNDFSAYYAMFGKMKNAFGAYGKAQYACIVKKNKGAIIMEMDLSNLLNLPKNKRDEICNKDIPINEAKTFVKGEWCGYFDGSRIKILESDISKGGSSICLGQTVDEKYNGKEKEILIYNLTGNSYDSCGERGHFANNSCTYSHDNPYMVHIKNKNTKVNWYELENKIITIKANIDARNNAPFGYSYSIKGIEVLDYK